MDNEGQSWLSKGDKGRGEYKKPALDVHGKVIMDCGRYMDLKKLDC